MLVLQLQAEAGKLSKEAGTNSIDRIPHRENCGAFGGSSVTVHLHIGIVRLSVLLMVYMQRKNIAIVGMLFQIIKGSYRFLREWFQAFVRNCVYCNR
jgi:hypothetical protein